MVTIDVPSTGGPDLRWAERIVARHAAGERVSSLPLRMAREALANNARRHAVSPAMPTAPMGIPGTPAQTAAIDEVHRG